jgi:hypothetical protein
LKARYKEDGFIIPHTFSNTTQIIDLCSYVKWKSRRKDPIDSLFDDDDDDDDDDYDDNNNNEDEFKKRISEWEQYKSNNMKIFNAALPIWHNLDLLYIPSGYT